MNGVFTIAVLGAGPLRYQWFFNGVIIPNATNGTLPIIGAALEMDGDYTVAITDDLGTNLSAPARLAVLYDPVIVQQPLSQSLLPGGSVTLSVTVSDIATLPVGYRWRRGSATIANLVLNSRTSFLTLTNLQPPSATWSVVVTNASRFTPGLLSSNAVITFLTDTNANGLADSWETTYFGPGNPVASESRL